VVQESGAAMQHSRLYMFPWAVQVAVQVAVQAAVQVAVQAVQLGVM
jgi:hypothetical protein